MVSSVRLLIADDHSLVAEALAIAARATLTDVVVDVANSIAEAEQLVRERNGYALLLLDLLLPDARGFSGFLRLQHALGNVPIVIVTGYSRPELIEAARALGAAGFLTKAQPLNELADAIRTVLRGGSVFPAAGTAAATIMSVRTKMKALSDAQLKVLLALANGRLNKQIAADLGIAEATVKAHLTAIFRKLGVANRTQALLAMQPLFGGPSTDNAP